MNKKALYFMVFVVATMTSCTSYNVGPGWGGWHGGGWGYGAGGWHGGGWGHTNVFVANNHYNYYHPGRW